MKKLLFGLLILVLVLTSLLASCATGTSTQTPTSTKTSTSQVKTSSSTSVSHWWDQYGTPQYGGEINYSVTGIIANFDNYNFIGADNDFWFESLFEPDWTLDRKIWHMGMSFYPDKYWTGNIAESWEMPDTQTIIVKIKQGVRWQNKSPVNGRELVADDIQKHYDRLLGAGSGYTWKAPMYAGMTTNWDRVTAIDKSTVQFKFKTPSGGTAFQTVADRFALNEIEPPEWVALGGTPTPPEPAAGGEGPPGGGGGGGGPPPAPTFGSGPLQEWRNAIGSGPWMLTDYVEGSKMTFSKNADYWGRDPRFPDNQIPYADTLNMLVIADSSTRLAALRTAQIDILGGGGPQGSVDWRQAQMLEKGNPELVKGAGGPPGGSGVQFKVSAVPFTDIKVRQAMQMAINRQEMAKSLFGGFSDGKPTGLVSQAYTGYCYSYADWPQELKDQYAYNPTKSRQLLAEAGYPDGFKTNVVAGTDAAAAEQMAAFKAYFFEIGIDMEIRTMDRVQSEVFIRAGKHDQMSAGGGGADFPPTRTIDTFWSKSPEILATDTNDPVYDAARDKFWAANNAEEAAAACQAADRRVIEQHWQVSMVGAPVFNFWQPYLKGYTNEAMQWGMGLYWARMWIDKSLKK